MEYIDDPDWKMLAQSWTDQDRDEELRANFFSDLSRIMLSLAQYPLPRIGSLTVDDQGLITLDDRRLAFRLQQRSVRWGNTAIRFSCHASPCTSLHKPFVFTLTDMHPNSTFVDANWHIKSLIDLEWSCVRPIEMMLLPPV